MTDLQCVVCGRPANYISNCWSVCSEHFIEAQLDSSIERLVYNYAYLLRHKTSPDKTSVVEPDYIPLIPYQSRLDY